MSVSVYRRGIGATAASFVERSSATGARVDAQGDPVPNPPVTTTCITNLAALEAALVNTPLRDWRQLTEEAPHASLFQSPGWCMPWYRCYEADYSPFVVMVTAGNALLGVVPMAVERGSGKLVFASDSMADYRDIVARREYRLAVLRELLRTFRNGGFPDPLQIGWLDPASDTAALLAGICEEDGLAFHVRHQPCYRWFPPPPKKPSAQKFLNWYKRQGRVEFEVIESREAWEHFREEYYRQHSLRQIQAGRERAFDDPRRTALYDDLFNSIEVDTHVTAFRLDGRLLAGHFGYVWRDVLLLGPPAISLEDEQRSPAVILLAWIIQNAERLGLAGFDLTIGDSDFKKRLGNHCVELTAVEIYARRSTYLRQRARTALVRGAKTAVARVAGPDAWTRHIKGLAPRIADVRRRAAELGVAGSIGSLLGHAHNAIHERRTLLVHALRSEDVQPEAPAVARGTIEVHHDRVADLLLWDGSTVAVQAAISRSAQSYSRMRAAGGSLHTVVADGKLAAWCYSSRPSVPVPLPMPEAVLTVEPGSAYISDLHVIGSGVGHVEPLLRAVAERRFAEGAPRVYATAVEGDAQLRAALATIGFEVIQRYRYERAFNRRSVTASSPGDAAGDFEEYLAEEWQLFAADPVRQEQARRAVEGVRVDAVLDVGCGGGQDLLPFASDSRCVGIDVSHASGVWGARQFSAAYPEMKVRFLTAAAEHLPFADGSFDLVLCRVAIPYTDNRSALREIGRVLRSGGILLLKTHSARYYLKKFADGIRRGSPLFSLHAIRVLVTGVVYHATGRQPGGRVLLRETFQSKWLLGSELARAGLAITGELPDSNPLTRSYRIVKRAPGTAASDHAASPPPASLVQAAQLLRRAARAVRRRVWHRKEICIYTLTAAEIARLPRPTRCRRDQWEDLQFCSAWSFSQLSREAYLAELSKRRESGGHHLYSLVEDGVLVHYGWLTSRQITAPDPPIGLVFYPPPDSAALWDYFTHPSARGRGLYRETLLQCAHDAVERDQAQNVFIYVDAGNTVSRHVIEKVGFRHVGSMVGERRLLRQRRFTIATSDALDVRLLPENTPASSIARPARHDHA